MSRFCVRWFTVWPSCQVALHLAVSCSQKVSIFGSLSYSIANPIHWIGVENGENILFLGLLVALLEMSLYTIWNEFQLCFWIWGCIAGCSMASWYMDILHCTFPFPLWCHLCWSLPPYATGWRKVLYPLLACFLFFRYWFPVMLLAPKMSLLNQVLGWCQTPLWMWKPCLMWRIKVIWPPKNDTFENG